MSYKVKLEMFEGPFDLLVYLIENAKMDIYDIKVAEITSQYLEYMEELDTVDVETAGEFMVLAANLIEIKSKLLLPKATKAEAGDEDEDPRTDLVEKILEYKKFKKAAELFSVMEDGGGKVFSKPAEDFSNYAGEPLENFTFDADRLVSTFEAFINKKHKVDEIRHYERVEKKKITSKERMGFIRNLFQAEGKDICDFNSTLENEKDPYDKALSFTSIMEMVKQRQVVAEQKRLFGDILLKKGDAFDKYDDEGRWVADEVDDKGPLAADEINDEGPLMADEIDDEV